MEDMAFMNIRKWSNFFLQRQDEAHRFPRFFQQMGQLRYKSLPDA